MKNVPASSPALTFILGQLRDQAQLFSAQPGLLFNLAPQRGFNWLVGFDSARGDLRARIGDIAVIEDQELPSVFFLSSYIRENLVDEFGHCPRIIGSER